MTSPLDHINCHTGSPPPQQLDLADLTDLPVNALLGRDPIDTGIREVGGYLTDKRVLVTGAGGSIGSELCRQIRACCADRSGPSARPSWSCSITMNRPCTPSI